MKIYDCFQFFDEEMLLDLRLNILDRYVDKFVISEAMYKHNGDKKKLNFDIIIRITGADILVDIDYMDKAIDFHLENNLKNLFQQVNF